MNKKISVLMGAYNCAETLEEAVNSIICQTYPDWELIICDDGSTDETYSVAKKIAESESRIILIRNDRNQGLACSLNNCLARASGSFIARMDADDISLPQRFEKEIEFLLQNPQYQIVSSAMIRFDEKGDWGTNDKVTNAPQACDFVKRTPFWHAPCMIRREALQAIGGYSTDKHAQRVEDYKLWFDLYEAGFCGYNLDEPLYKQRDDAAAAKRRRFKFALNEASVRFNGYKQLGLPLYCRIYALRPIAVALLPKPIYNKLHKYRFRKR